MANQASARSKWTVAELVSWLEANADPTAEVELMDWASNVTRPMYSAMPFGAIKDRLPGKLVLSSWSI